MGEDRVVFIDGKGRAQCINAKAMAKMPAKFDGVLGELCADMELALECLDLFGAVPVPVAKAIIRNYEPAVAAMHEAMHSSPLNERLVH